MDDDTTDIAEMEVDIAMLSARIELAEVAQVRLPELFARVERLERWRMRQLAAEQDNLKPQAAPLVALPEGVEPR